MKNRLYVGVMRGTWEYVVFYSPDTPSEATHGDMFAYVIGPFRTRAGADVMAKYGRNNPCLQTVTEAERMARGL